ncbi:MAG: hypothetical protein MR384_13250 [Lachnospiraceae bacterium]|nr:hypothetical protein [Lachnospiraceae bacterium]
MDIEVNEYVRTYYGISKVIEAVDQYITEKEICVDFIRNMYNQVISKRQVIKHSKNIIDLVKVGDICMFKNNCVYIYDNDFLNAVKENVKNGNRLLKVLTKEQFEQNSYKVGEEDE